jgi:hypothetical protein
MKKLLLLTLFVCIGSIKISSQVRISPVESKKIKFYKNYKFYKNALGERYDLFGNDDEEIDWRNQLILEDFVKMIRENITKITFSPWLNIERIYSESDFYKSEVAYDIFSPTRGFVFSRILTTKPGTQKPLYDSRNGFIEQGSRIEEFYMYKDDLIPIEDNRYRNKLKKIIVYDDRMFLGNMSEMKIIEDNREGGGNYARGIFSIKKNGITKYYRAGKIFGELYKGNVAEKEILYIQDVPILIKKNKKIIKIRNTPTNGLTENMYGYSETEFEILKEDEYGKPLINEFDIESMIEIFIKDYKGFANYYDIYLDNFDVKQKITATFESLEGNILAKALGRGYNNQIVIKIDPEKWAKASSIKRWYILYHELGHDFLNFRHGQGGKMMFNYPLNSQITIENFVEDRNYMFKSYFKKAIE